MTLVTACGRGKKAVATLDKPENQDMLRKLEGYTNCLYEADKVFALANVYRDQQASGLAGDVPQAPDPSPCVSQMIESAAMPPYIPDLDRAAAAYLAVFVETCALATPIQRPFAEPIPPTPAMRAALAKAFDRFDQVQAQLFDRVYQLNHTTHAAQLALRQGQEGRNLGVVAEDFMLHAEELVAVASTSPDALATIDVATYTAKLVATERVASEMSAMALAHPEDAKALMEDFSSTFPPLANKFLVACRQLAARAKDHVEFTASEKLQIAAHDEASVIGTPASVVRAYNALVESYYPSISWPH